MQVTPVELRSLSRVAEILDKAGFPVHLREATEEIPFDQLLVALDEDESEQIHYPLQLFYQEDILELSEPQSSAVRGELEESATLCFLLELERTLPATEQLGDLYRLLNLWNGLMPYGTFLIQEAAPQSILFRYALPHDEGLNLLLVAEILEMLGFYFNRLLPLLDQWLITPIPVQEMFLMTELELATEVAALHLPKTAPA